MPNLPIVPPGQPKHWVSSLPEANEGPAERQLAALVSTGLISPEQQRSLSVATTNLDVMKRVASNPGERHFGRIDLMMSVKAPTAIARGREVLAQLSEAWEGMSHDFHHFRKRFFEGKAALAKLSAKRRKVETLRARAGTEGNAAELEDEATILEAECEYEQSIIDEIQHDVAVGQAKLQGKLKIANEQSQHYALICREAGRDPDAGGFTEDDFLQEELDYYLKSAWWCASEQFQEVDIRDAIDRKKRDAHYAAMAGMPGMDERAIDAKKRADMRRNGHSRIQVPREVILFFEGMGVTQQVIKHEVGVLNGQREGFKVFERSGIGSGAVAGYAPQDFMPNFLSWLDAMVVKYRAQALQAYQTQGRDRLKRLAALLDPSDQDIGQGDREKQKRESTFE